MAIRCRSAGEGRARGPHGVRAVSCGQVAEGGATIGHVIAGYGCLALFALVGAESMGVPLPGETAMGHRGPPSPFARF
jgi:hypothetical protein